MNYDKQTLLSLPPKEKLQLAEELWASVESELIPISNEEIAFAQERLHLYETNPKETVSLNLFQKYFKDKYGV